MTGDEDGAHHVIAEVSQALNDIGDTCPGQNWTDWTHSTGDAMASNLVHTARALQAASIPPPPGS